MGAVLISIKPEYVKRIASGEKRFEFRKRIFNRQVDKAVVYASSPVRRVVGEFDVGQIIEGSPGAVWERCRFAAGIDKVRFMRYFDGCDIAFAIPIEEYRSYIPPKNISDFGVVPPQSYCYLSATY